MIEQEKKAFDIFGIFDILLTKLNHIEEEIIELKTGNSKTQLLSTSQVVKMLNIGKSTIYYKLEKDKDFPKPIKIGRNNKWELSDIEKYITQNKVTGGKTCN